MKDSETGYTQTTQTGPVRDTRTDRDLKTADLRAENLHLREENERLNQELRREHEVYIHNLADFDKYRRRAERELAQAGRSGKRELILELLGVVDDFERALAGSGEESQAMTEKFRPVYERLADLLSAQGVTAFESRGRRFDPTRHEVIDLVESEGSEPGTVLDEISRGYRWGEELLRPARVRVAR